MEYSILRLDDISTLSTKRLSAKMLSTTKDKTVIKGRLKHIIRELSLSSYCKTGTKDRFGDQPYKVIYLNIYTHKRQLNYGLPLCTVQWISPDAEYKPQEINYNDSFESLLIQWGEFHETLDRMIQENEVSREKFLEDNTRLTKLAFDIGIDIKKNIDRFLNNEISVGNFREEVLKYSEQLESFANEFEGFPESSNEELVLLQFYSRNAIDSLHNVIIVAGNVKYAESNLIYLTKRHIEEAIVEFDNYYELLDQIG